jgi:hypothetical protein
VASELVLVGKSGTEGPVKVWVVWYSVLSSHVRSNSKSREQQNKIFL